MSPGLVLPAVEGGERERTKLKWKNMDGGKGGGGGKQHWVGHERREGWGRGEAALGGT